MKLLVLLRLLKSFFLTALIGVSLKLQLEETLEIIVVSRSKGLVFNT